ncbi:hypothetical protein ACFFNA_23295, partial [Mesorhizobium kowhaii]|uniref:hypothetical protein n=1 Tax=Mesorhizobium kowhaii TaxID=1300272 RepID=UPI0035EEFA0E
RHPPQIEISIAIDCGPRVPSSGTFVRLPAPETLHESSMSAFKTQLSEADIRQTTQCRSLTGFFPIRKADAFSTGAMQRASERFFPPRSNVLPCERPS